MSTPDHLSRRPTFTPDQVNRYLKHISYPQLFPQTTTEDLLFSHFQASPLKTLTTLLRHQLSTISFDSLVLHYSQHHTVSVHPDAIFEKFVASADKGLGNRGGYCMENNTFFVTALRSLGFEVLTCGARVANAANGVAGGGFLGWSHMVLLVRIEGKRYLVDVGFGPQGPITPLPLEENTVSAAIDPASVRLIKDTIAPNTDSTQKLWIYQSRETPSGPWLTNYCFTELEFLPEDFEVMNFKTSYARTSWFTYKIVCCKFLVEGDEIVGTMTLIGDQLKRKVRGKPEHLATFQSEGERIEALEKWFGVILKEEEREGIKGTVAMIPAKWS